MKNYKLYSFEKGYKCRVNTAELVFLFNINASAGVEEINNYIFNAGYYITE